MYYYNKHINNIMDDILTMYGNQNFIRGNQIEIRDKLEKKLKNQTQNQMEIRIIGYPLDNYQILIRQNQYLKLDVYQMKLDTNQKKIRRDQQSQFYFQAAHS